MAASPTASVEAAIAHAAHDTLATPFPGTTVDLAGELASALTALAPTTSVSEIPRRQGGWQGSRPCDDRGPQRRWRRRQYAVRPRHSARRLRPTGSGPAASPNWPRVKPFCMTSGSQFRPPRPGGYLSKARMLRSGEYAAQLNEIKQLGKSNSTVRTNEQEEIALF